MEVRIRTGGQNDEQIPKHCDQVHGQEQSKENLLYFRIISKTQEEESGY
jgi:hypothetical protein